MKSYCVVTMSPFFARNGDRNPLFFYWAGCHVDAHFTKCKHHGVITRFSGFNVHYYVHKTKPMIACIELKDRIESITSRYSIDCSKRAPTVPFDPKLHLVPTIDVDPIIAHKNLQLQGSQLYLEPNMPGISWALRELGSLTHCVTHEAYEA